MERHWQEGLSRLLSASLEAGKGRLAAGDEVTASRFFEQGATYDPASFSTCRRWARALWHLDRMDRYLAQGQYRRMLEQAQAALVAVEDERPDGPQLILGRLQHRLESALESAQAAEEWADVQTAVKWVEEHYRDEPTYANWVSQVQRRGRAVESKLASLRRTLTTQALEWFERVKEADKEAREQGVLKAHGYVERALLISTPGDPNRENLERAKAWLDSLLTELRGKDEREELRGKLKHGNVALGAGNFEAARSVYQEVQNRAEQRGYQDLAAEVRLALDDVTRAQEHQGEVKAKVGEAQRTLQAAEELERHASLSATKAAQEELYEDILGRVREVLSLHRWHREALEVQQIVEDKLDRGGFRRWLALRERADQRLEPVRKAFKEAKVRFLEGKVGEAEVILDQCEEPVLLQTVEDYKLVREDIRRAKEVLKVTRNAQARGVAFEASVLRSLEPVVSYKLPAVYWEGINQYLYQVQDSCVHKFQQLQSDNIYFPPALRELVWVNQMLRRVRIAAETESKDQNPSLSDKDLEDFVARMRKLAREKEPSKQKILAAVERLLLADPPQTLADEVAKLAKQPPPPTFWERASNAFQVYRVYVLAGIAGLVVIALIVMFGPKAWEGIMGRIEPVPTTQVTRTPLLTHIPTSTPPVVPTDTPVPPTDTPVPPTDTPVLPTDTPVLPTDTPVLPTDTPVPPTDTPVLPTDTPIPPTETPVPTATPSIPPLPEGRQLLRFVDDTEARFLEPSDRPMKWNKDLDAGIGGMTWVHHNTPDVISGFTEYDVGELTVTWPITPALSAGKRYEIFVWVPKEHTTAREAVYRVFWLDQDGNRIPLLEGSIEEMCILQDNWHSIGGIFSLPQDAPLEVELDVGRTSTWWSPKCGNVTRENQEIGIDAITVAIVE